MNADEQWLIDQGFPVEVELDSKSGEYWVHLLNRTRRRVAPNYGRGNTADESIASAPRRYEVEELGI